MVECQVHIIFVSAIAFKGPVNIFDRVGNLSHVWVHKCGGKLWTQHSRRVFCLFWCVQLDKFLLKLGLWLISKSSRKSDQLFLNLLVGLLGLSFWRIQLYYCINSLCDFVYLIQKLGLPQIGHRSGDWLFAHAARTQFLYYFWFYFHAQSDCVIWFLTLRPHVSGHGARRSLTVESAPFLLERFWHVFVCWAALLLKHTFLAFQIGLIHVPVQKVRLLELLRILDFNFFLFRINVAQFDQIAGLWLEKHSLRFNIAGLSFGVKRVFLRTALVNIQRHRNCARVLQIRLLACLYLFGASVHHLIYHVDLRRRQLVVILLSQVWHWFNYNGSFLFSHILCLVGSLVVDDNLIEVTW